MMFSKTYFTFKVDDILVMILSVRLVNCNYKILNTFILKSDLIYGILITLNMFENHQNR